MFSSRKALVAASAGVAFLLVGIVCIVVILKKRTHEEESVTQKMGAAPTTVVEEPSAQPPQTADKTARPTITFRNPKLRTLVDRDAGGSIPVNITTEIPRVTHPDDLAALGVLLQDVSADDTVRNEAANLLRRSEHPGLVDMLMKVLGNRKEGDRFRAFAVQHLWQSVASGRSSGRAKVAARLRDALGDRSVAVRREALLALVRLKDPKGREVAELWLTADNVDELRDAAIRCIQQLGLREHIPSIRRHLKDEDEVVRIAAIVALSQWGDAESKPAFEEAAKSESVRLRRCGEAALKRLGQAGTR